MGAEYAIKDIPSSRLTAWDSMKLNPKIQIPQQNPYLPAHFELVSSEADAATAENPLLLYSSEGSQVYFAQDTRYQVPEIATIFNFKSPLINQSAKSQVLTDLYLRALKEKLSSTLFFARCAKINTGFRSDDLSIKLIMQGFSDKAPILLNTIFQSLHDVAPSKDQFEIYRASLASDYDNASKELPYRQASEVMESVIFNKATNGDKFKAIKQLSYDEFLTFSKNLFSKTYTQAMLYGNLTQADADRLWQNLNQTLASKPFPVSEQQKKEGPHLVQQIRPLHALPSDRPSGQWCDAPARRRILYI